jgi:predicted phage terminase large subunit-like protein
MKNAHSYLLPRQIEADVRLGPCRLGAVRVRGYATDIRRRMKRIAARQTGGDELSLLAWARRFLPQHFTLAPSLMHRWLEEQLDAMPKVRGMKLNVIGPRGGAMSTIVTLAWPLRLAVEAREPYIWIASDTKHQACAHLDNVKAELLENAELAEFYPDATGRGLIWRENFIRLNNGVVIEAFGTGQRIRGRRRRAHRPTLIVCDDLQNDQHIESALQRERSSRWFHGTLLKAGTKRTNLVNLATALHRDALALELHRTPGWTSRLFPAIERWPDDMLLWQEWETVYANLDNPQARDDARAFFEGRRADMERGAVLLWPDEEDLYTLMCMRVESGRTSFEREKQGSPINPELCEWPESYFEGTLWFEDWPQNVRLRTMALDPSKGHDACRGDYSAFVMLALDDAGFIYLEADLARRPTPQMVADGVELLRRFRPDAFGVEANQFQELLAPAFAEELARQGMLGVQPWTLDNHTNKRVRIRRLGPYLASRRLRFKSGSPATALLVDQLKEFPVAEHDDGPDAAEMAIRLAAELLNGANHDDGLGGRLLI